MSIILRRIEAEVKIIIEKHKELIEKIAGELLAQESFSGDKLRELLTEEKVA